MSRLTAEKLREVLHYDPLTGMFTNRITRAARAKEGVESGSTHRTKGYREIMVAGERHYAHRLAWLYVYGEFPQGELDHINGNRDDNRISNLRTVPHAVNQRNLKRSANNTSGITGVYWSDHYQKWIAHITADRKAIHLGCFDTADEAVAARRDAEVWYQFHPNHGRTEQERAAFDHSGETQADDVLARLKRSPPQWLNRRGKLSPSEVLDIRRRLGRGELMTKIAKRHKVSVPTISHIKTGKRHAAVTA